MFLSTFQLLPASDGRSSCNTSPTFAPPYNPNIQQYDMISQKYIMSSAYSLSRYPTTSIFWQMNMRTKKMAFRGVRLSEKQVLIITAMTILNDFIFYHLTKLTAKYFLLDVSFCQQLAGAQSFSIITHLWMASVLLVQLIALHSRSAASFSLSESNI